MAKKNYQNIEVLTIPKIENQGKDIVLVMECENTEGTRIRVTLRMLKYLMPHLVKSFMDVAKDDSGNANRFVQRIKESAA